MGPTKHIPGFYEGMLQLPHSSAPANSKAARKGVEQEATQAAALLLISLLGARTRRLVEFSRASCKSCNWEDRTTNDQILLLVGKRPI
jgi:hypothetical protein